MCKYSVSIKLMKGGEATLLMVNQLICFYSAQSIFTAYRQPFAITYLGVSLMAIYLPIAIIKDWICSLCGRHLFRNLLHGNRGTNDLSELDIPLRSNEDDLHDREEGWPLMSKSEEHEPSFHGQSTELGSWEIVKYSVFVTPVWFFTEVTIRVYFGIDLLKNRVYQQ